MKGPSQLSFIRGEPDGEATLAITGEIDAFVESKFREEIHSLIDRAHSPAVIDLAAVSYIDSSGLRVLLGARTHARDRGVTLVLQAPSSFVRRVLDITGVADDFDIRASA